MGNEFILLTLRPYIIKFMATDPILIPLILKLFIIQGSKFIHCFSNFQLGKKFVGPVIILVEVVIRFHIIES